MNNPDFILKVLVIADSMAGDLPDDAAWYADEEFRTVFFQIRELFSVCKIYRGELPESKKTPGVATRDTHVGTSDYSKKAIQPWDVWLEYFLNPWDADIVKRVIRTKTEPGVSPQTSRIQDYQKIIHICQERIDQVNAGDPFYQKFTMPPWVVSDT